MVVFVAVVVVVMAVGVAVWGIYIYTERERERAKCFATEAATSTFLGAMFGAVTLGVEVVIQAPPTSNLLNLEDESACVKQL